MAGSIKGLNIEIGGDTTKLTDALKKPAQETKNLQSELKGVNNALKFDTNNVDLLDQKQRLLKSAIDSTEQELKLLKEAQKQYVDSGKDIDGAEYIALEEKIAKTQKSLENLKNEQSNFTGELQAMGNKLGEFGEKATKTGESLTKSVTAPIAGLGTVAVKTAADFDSGMSEVAAISGATGSDLEALRDKAKEMGETTKFSASESAEALKYMAMAGWEPEQMLDGLSGVMNLAAASGEELGTTSDIVTDALTAFGMKAEEAGHFADVLATASSSSNTNVSLLGESFKYVAPVAGSLGASAEDTAIALGLMANAGVKGSQAGNSLKNALVNLYKPTEDQAAAMKQLGIIQGEWVTSSATDQAKVEKLNEIILDREAALSKAQEAYNKAVEKHGENSTEAENAYKKVESAQMKLTAAHTELQKEMEKTDATFVETGNLLQDEYGNTKSLGEIMDVLRSKLGKVDVELTNADGSARDYDEIMADLSETTEGLAQAQQIEAAATLFGKQNLAGMLAVINASEEDYNSLTDAIYGCEGSAQTMADTMNDNLNGQITLLKSALEGLAISFGEILMPVIRSVVEKIQAFVEKLNSMSDGQKKAVAAIAAIAAAIGPCLIAIGKMSTGVSALIKYFGSMTTAGGKVISFIENLTGASSIGVGAFAAITAAVVAVVAAFVDLWKNNEEFREKMISIWDGLKQKFQDFAQGIVDRLNDLGFNFENFSEVVGAVWKGFCDLLAPIFEGAWKFIADTLDGILDVITGLLDVFIGLFTGDWEQCWDGVKEIFGGCWDWVVDTLETAWEVIEGLLDAICGWFGTDWETLWDGIKQPFEKAWGWITEKFQGVVDTIKSIWEPITEFFQGIWDIIKGIWEGDSDLISKGIEECWSGIKGYTEAVWNAIKDFWKGLWKSLKDFGSGVWNFMTEDIPKAWNTIKDKTKEIWGNIKSFCSDTWDNMKETVSDTWDNMKETVSDRWEKIKTGTSEFCKIMGEKLGTKWDELKKDASEKFTKIKESISDTWDKVKTTAADKWGKIKEDLKTKWNDIKTNADNLGRGICNHLSLDWDEVKRTASQKWEGVKNAIMTPFNSAKESIRLGIDAIKGFFNFQFRWPHIPMPHFRVSGSLNPFDWFDGGRLPSIGVEWYAKAMDGGMILNQPTIFGAANGKLLGGGEAGSEVVVGAVALQRMIAKAATEANSKVVADSMRAITDGLNNLNARMQQNLERLRSETSDVSGGIDSMEGSMTESLTGLSSIQLESTAVLQDGFTRTQGVFRELLLSCTEILNTGFYTLADLLSQQLHFLSVTFGEINNQAWFWESIRDAAAYWSNEYAWDADEANCMFIHLFEGMEDTVKNAFTFLGDGGLQDVLYGATAQSTAAQLEANKIAQEQMQVQVQADVDYTKMAAIMQEGFANMQVQGDVYLDKARTGKLLADVVDMQLAKKANQR